MNKFQINLLQGQKYEKKCLEYLHYDSVEFPPAGVIFKDYDLTIIKNNVRTTIEVKSDRQASITNNLCIECEHNNKPSGISTTKAEYWIYFIVFPTHEECYRIPTNELKNLVKNCKIFKGGDRGLSRMYLLSKYKLQNYLIYPKKEKPFIDTLLEEFNGNNSKATYRKDEVIDIIKNFFEKIKEEIKKI